MLLTNRNSSALAVCSAGIKACSDLHEQDNKGKAQMLLLLHEQRKGSLVTLVTSNTFRDYI